MIAERLQNVKRILVLNRNQIGDCLLTTPLLRALKRGYPGAHLAVAIPEPRRDLLATNPHVDEIVIRPRRDRWVDKFQFAIDIRRRDYDLIISLQEKSLFYAWATYYAALARSRCVTVALDHPRTRRYYQQNVPIQPDRHEVYKYLDIARLIHCPAEQSPVLELQPTKDARAWVRQFVSDRGVDPDTRFIAINPGATMEEKRWPVERFAEVAERLHQELGLPVMILGGEEDRERAAGIVNGMTHRPLVTAGMASLAHTAALLERCELLVTGDTGPMHMAVAMAVPVVALFGPTNPLKFGPFSRNKVVLRHDEPCETCALPCTHTITAEECLGAAMKLYNPPPGRRAGVERR